MLQLAELHAQSSGHTLDICGTLSPSLSKPGLPTMIADSARNTAYRQEVLRRARDRNLLPKEL